MRLNAAKAFFYDFTIFLQKRLQSVLQKFTKAFYKKNKSI